MLDRCLFRLLNFDNANVKSNAKRESCKLAFLGDFLRCNFGGVLLFYLPCKRYPKTIILAYSDYDYHRMEQFLDYRHTLPPEQLDAAWEVVGDLEPCYVGAFDKVLSGTSAHLFNMMVMRADVLDAYCSWLFPILFEVIRRHDPSSYDSFYACHPGRIGELLLDAEGIPCVELPAVTPEPVNRARKDSAFLAAAFLGRKYVGSF